MMKRSILLTMNPCIRFLRQAETHGLDPERCWEWQGSVNSNGYGRFVRKNRHLLAHRVAYEMFCGPIPEGHNVCHRCDNRLCVNPDHLWTGTQSENLKDAVAKGRMYVPNLPPEMNGNGKLRPEQVRRIRKDARRGIRKRVLADQYGVSLSTVYGIVNRRTWKDQQYG